MDVVSKILDSLKLSSSFYFDTEFGAPWSVRVPDYQQVARFHYVTHGSCWIDVAGGSAPVQLHSKDFVLVPHGNMHVICSNPEVQVVELENALAQSGYPGRGTWVLGNPDQDNPTRLICGHFQFNENFQHPLIRQLPELLIVRESQALDFSWFTNALKLLSVETQSNHLGQAAIIRHLTEIVFILMIRVWAKSSELPGGFLRVIQDKAIGRSLTAFHNAPGEKWSVAKLASHAGMSRTAYAERFKGLSGISPMRYATDWRMQCAGQLLLETRLSMEQIAEQVGYQSVPAFARIFKLQKCIGPGAFRRVNQRPKTDQI